MCLPLRDLADVILPPLAHVAHELVRLCTLGVHDRTVRLAEYGDEHVDEDEEDEDDEAEEEQRRHVGVGILCRS